MVFQDEHIVNFIDSQFISMKVNGESGEGPELMKKLNIPGYPTVLLFQPDGTEIDRIVGFDGNKQKYFQTLKNYTNGLFTLADYLSRVKEEPDNVLINYKIAEKYRYRQETEKAIVYYNRVLSLDPGDKNGYKTNALFQIVNHELNSNKKPESMKAFIESCRDKEFKLRGYSALTRFYRNEQNYHKMSEIYERALKEFPEDTRLMNSYAWTIFQNKLVDYYDRGIQVAQLAVQLNPDSHYIWDTLGQLYFENGQVMEAIEAMEKASALQPDEESYQRNLKKYKDSVL